MPATLLRSDATMPDQFGRIARDLRVSVTERCTLRCRYCMPAEGLPRIPTAELLTPAEITRLVRIAVDDLGIREVRFTGGEPLVRRELVEIFQRVRDAVPGVPLALTTNAIGLQHHIDALMDAGLARVNISLDTINRGRFAELTRRDRLPAVLQGVAAAKAAGIAPIKVNAVLMRQTLPDVPDLVRWAHAEGVQLRFIEQMPLDADRTWDAIEMVTAAELRAVLAEHWDVTELPREDAASPAETWALGESEGTVGVIASVTRSFCGACDRTRLSAEGRVRPCLFSDNETDLRALLRGGADDAAVSAAWRGATWNKVAGHRVGEKDFEPTVRTMGAIGG